MSYIGGGLGSGMCVFMFTDKNCCLFRFRLLALDHDIFSFTDTRLDQWPLVLLTNPKDAHFVVPTREPSGKMSHSTHIRLLAFSPAPLMEMSVWVDGERLDDPQPTSAGSPLFTVPWQPEKYAFDLHTIRVSVKVCCMYMCVSR